MRLDDGRQAHQARWSSLSEPRTPRLILASLGDATHPRPFSEYFKKYMKKTLSIVLATVWISASEFFRNQFLFQKNWQEHYQNMGLTFPSANINGAIWGLWSLLLAIAILIIAKKYSLLATTLIVWLIAFVLMWLTIGNLKVLPYSILYLAIPLSIIEVLVATWIIKK